MGRPGSANSGVGSSSSSSSSRMTPSWPASVDLPNSSLDRYNRHCWERCSTSVHPARHRFRYTLYFDTRDARCSYYRSSIPDDDDDGCDDGDDGDGADADPAAPASTAHSRTSHSRALVSWK